VDNSKREFLKKGLAGVGITVIGGVIISQGGNILGRIQESSTKKAQDSTEQTSSGTPDDPERHWGFLIDLGKCNGCEDQPTPPNDPTNEKPWCSYACRTSHFYVQADPPQYWIRVYEQQENPHAPPFHFPKPCMNCENPPCLRVCPTGATFKRKDGTVLINHEICIGCRLCMAACPYETRFFWYSDPIKEEGVENLSYSPEHPVPHSRGTVVKCDFCLPRAYSGQVPDCVSACPQGALYYGDLKQDAVSNGDEVISLRQKLETRGGYRYKEEEETHPSVFYLPPSQTTINNKIEGELGIDIQPIKNSDDIKVITRVTTKTGSPIPSAMITISKQTKFGLLSIAEGKTDSKGHFKCSVSITPNQRGIIRAEMAETDRYGRKMVRRHV
jgi:Fe-S-cluster-containing dehydrogenase component